MVLIEIITRLFAILQWIVELLFPIKFIVVEEPEKGIRLTCGKPGKQLEFDNGLFKTGIHPGTIFQRLEKAPAYGLVMKVEAVSVFTQEGIPMSVWAAVTYNLVDYRLTNKQYELEDRIEELVTADILARFAKLSAADSIGPMNKVETALGGALKNSLEPLGVELDSKPRITGRDLGEGIAMNALLLPVVEAHLETEFSKGQRAAIIAGATVGLSTDDDDGEEEDPEEGEESGSEVDEEE